eukprot:Trichotokara_eunicae@DN1600_c0_g1_i2.p1
MSGEPSHGLPTTLQVSPETGCPKCRLYVKKRETEDHAEDDDEGMGLNGRRIISCDRFNLRCFLVNGIREGKATMKTHTCGPMTLSLRFLHDRPIGQIAITSKTKDNLTLWKQKKKKKKKKKYSALI